MAGSELTVYGVVGYDSDEEQDDNRTKTAVVTKVKGSSYPVATGLTGSREGTAIKLAWSAPSLSKPVAEVVTDGFEDYDPFTICLLYTSPSPRDRQKSRMPSSA